jgi:hypothetical protein
MITEREKKWLEENSSWIEDEKTDLETFGNKAFTSLNNDSGMKLSMLFAETRGGHSFYIKKLYPSQGKYRYSFYIKQPDNKLFYLYTTATVDRPLENQEILLSIDHQVSRLGLRSQKLNNLYRNLQVSR